MDLGRRQGMADEMRSWFVHQMEIPASRLSPAAYRLPPLASRIQWGDIGRYSRESVYLDVNLDLNMDLDGYMICTSTVDVSMVDVWMYEWMDGWTDTHNASSGASSRACFLSSARTRPSVSLT